MSPRWMFSPALTGRWVRIAAVVALAGVLSVAPGFSQEADPDKVDTSAEVVDPALAQAAESASDVPYELRQALSAPLDAKVKQVAQKKNAEGIANSGAYYSKRFRKVDADTYRTTYFERTAEPDRLTIQRYTALLEQKGANWELGEVKLEDTFDQMTRAYAPPVFYAFSATNLSREGLKVTSGPGALYARYRDGKIVGFTAIAERMKYQYEVPPDVPVGYYSQVIKVFRSRYANQINFDPIRMAVRCDPESCADLLKTSFEGLAEVPPVTEAKPTWSAPATPSGGVKALADYYAKVSKEYATNLKESPFGGFQPPDDPENRYYSVNLFKNDDDNLFVGYDNFDAEEIQVGVGIRNTPLYGAVINYPSEATRKSGIDPYELERRDDEEARYYHLTAIKGEVACALDDPETYRASLDYGLAIKRDVSLLPYFVATIQTGEGETSRRPSLNVNLVEVDGEELTVVRTGAFSGIIVLPKVAKAGSKLDLRMEFGARAIQKVNPAFSQMNRGGWLPFVRFGDMIDQVEMTIKVPKGYKTLGIGGKVGERDEGEVNITEWKAGSPVAFPTIIFGKYVEDSSAPEYVAKKPDGTEVPVTVHVDEISMGTLKIDIASYEDAVDTSTAFGAGARGIRGKQLKPIALQAATAIDLYEDLSGIPYPYAELNLVNDPAPALYGQAPSSLIYLGSLVFRGSGTMAGDTFLGGGGANISKFLKSVTAHEVGHQWWGSAVANANGRNYWFVETLAEFFSAIWLERAFGPKEYQQQVDEWRKRILDVDMLTSVQRSTSDFGGESPGASYQAAVYNKGPYAFHVLRKTFGDEKFFPALKQVSQELAGKGEIVSRDIQMAWEDALGGVGPDGKPYRVDLSWFFDQWIRGVGIPEYSFSYASRQNEQGQWIVEGKVKQRVVMGNRARKYELPGTYYRGVVPVTVVGRKQEYAKRLVVEGPETPFTLVVPEQPVEIFLNRNGDILAHDVLVNRSW